MIHSIDRPTGVPLDPECGALVYARELLFPGGSQGDVIDFLQACSMRNADLYSIVCQEHAAKDLKSILEGVLNPLKGQPCFNPWRSMKLPLQFHRTCFKRDPLWALEMGFSIPNSSKTF